MAVELAEVAINGDVVKWYKDLSTISRFKRLTRNAKVQFLEVENFLTDTSILRRAIYSHWGNLVRINPESYSLDTQKLTAVLWK